LNRHEISLPVQGVSQRRCQGGPTWTQRCGAGRAFPGVQVAIATFQIAEPRNGRTQVGAQYRPPHHDAGGATPPHRKHAGDRRFHRRRACLRAHRATLRVFMQIRAASGPAPAIHSDNRRPFRFQSRRGPDKPPAAGRTCDSGFLLWRGVRAHRKKSHSARSRRYPRAVWADIARRASEARLLRS
jgi:hypothetical protein